MFSFVDPLCFVLLVFPRQINADLAALVAPAAFHAIQVGMPYQDVKVLLGPAPHGSWWFECGYDHRIGRYSATMGEGRWDTSYGTISVRYLNSKVTARSFTPNRDGIEALRIIQGGTLLLRNTLLRNQVPRFGLQPLIN